MSRPRARHFTLEVPFSTHWIVNGYHIITYLGKMLRDEKVAGTVKLFLEIYLKQDFGSKVINFFFNYMSKGSTLPQR